jgi:hypothetical protein
MKWEFKQLLPSDLSPASKTWIYQSNRRLSLHEALETEAILEQFIENWQSHGSPVKGFGNLFFGQFIVLMADETATHVGGCSTDSSVRMIKAIENKFGLHLFDRQLLAFLKEDNIQLIPYQQVNYAYANGFIDDETIYFNNLVDTKKAMEENWMIPLRNSWLAKNLTSQVS